MARADTKLKPKHKKLTQKEQSERFRQTARELGCDESEDALERAFKKIVPSRKSPMISGNPT
jgi:hypothetical protein